MTFHSPLPKSLLRFADRLHDYNDERADDNPIFLAYAPGWCSWSDFPGLLHSDSAMNIREALSLVRNAVPCTCKECVCEACHELKPAVGHSCPACADGRRSA